jgi:aspartate-semialdehyde dehydrogenase
MSVAEAGGPKVAVVGASGTVGGQLVELIEARAFRYAELKLFALRGGLLQDIEAGERHYGVVQLKSSADLADFDIVFLAVPQNVAAEIVGSRPGPLLIDLSGATRAPSAAVPMVAPGLTPRDLLQELRARGGVFETPHPAAHVLATILSALGPDTGPVAATVLLSASGGGLEQISKLAEETIDLLNARLDLEEGEIQRAFNTFVSNTETEAASAISAQTAKLLGRAPNLMVQAVRVPVFHGCAIGACVFAAGDTSKWIERVRAAPGLLMVGETESAGLVEAIGEDAVLVRASLRPDGMTLWCVLDNARLAALDALWIAESLALTAGSNLA